MLKSTGEDARNRAELVQRLAKMYATSTNKIDLERQFAEIHPHKDFILKYCSPKQMAKAPEPPKMEDDACPTTAPPIITQHTSNADGTCNCNCYCCKERKEKFSGVDGESPRPTKPENSVLIAGMVTMVCIVALIVFNKKD